MMGRIAIVAALLITGGCVNYVETVHVRVRDPAAVAVSIAVSDDRNRRETLIAATAEPGSAEIPPVSPPYLEAAQPGASVMRYDQAALAALCIWCTWPAARPLVAANGTIALTGSPSHVLSRTGDQVHLRFDYEASLPCHRGHGDCVRPAFVLSLDTPRANLLDLHLERRVSTEYGELTGAKLGLVAGVFATALGYTMFGLALDPHLGGTHWDLAGGGILGSAVGGVFLGTSIATLLAHDTDWAIPPP